LPSLAVVVQVLVLIVTVIIFGIDLVVEAVVPHIRVD
jgi:hypothetical protein